jgi:hypothetical protein
MGIELPAKALWISPVNHKFLKKFRKVIISEEKWRDLKCCDKTSKSGGKWRMGNEVEWNSMKWYEVKWSTVKWSELNRSVMRWTEICVLSLICSYVAVCKFFAIRWPIIINLSLSLTNYSIFQYIFISGFLFFVHFLFVNSVILCFFSFCK